ncbi:MAG: hypothetical protein K9J06_08180 [Flavobacteriales bacterium]|nr:hypothetical protein [Flavobacteriales bacterium]
MAKSQHSFMKRQREIDKKKKAASKREKREEKKNMPAGSGPEVVSYVVNHGIVVGSMGEGEMQHRNTETRPVADKDAVVKKVEKAEKAEKPERAVRPEKAEKL